MALDTGALNNLENQCRNLTPGTEYVIQMTQKELDEQFTKAIKNTGCEVKKGKNGKIIIVKKKEEEDPLAGWEDFDEDMKKFDKKTQKEAEQEKRYLALATYEEKFSKTLLDTLKGIKNHILSTQQIINNLQIMKKDVYAGNIVSSEENRQKALEGLQTIQMIYGKDKIINNLVKQIIDKLNSYKIDPNYAA